MDWITGGAETISGWVVQTEAFRRFLAMHTLNQKVGALEEGQGGVCVDNILAFI